MARAHETEREGMRFARTEKAATKDKRSRWDLIEAIAADAVDNGFPIVGHLSVEAAAQAIAGAGDEMALSTIRGLCSVAKFDNESTAVQRRVWRRYGWASIGKLVGAGWSQEAAADFLRGEHKTRADIGAVLASSRARPTEPGINERWGQWVTRMNNLMMDGARLLHETEATKIELTGQAHLALTIYQRLTERQLDAELRELFESENVK